MSFTSSTTKTAVLRRVRRQPEFEVVPEHAIRLFEHVIEQTETEAIMAHPHDIWARVQYWKDAIMARVAPHLRGVIAVYFHEYVAATMRGDAAEFDSDVDVYGFSQRPYNPQAEDIARRDAYLACTASLT